MHRHGSQNLFGYLTVRKIDARPPYSLLPRGFNVPNNFLICRGVDPFGVLEEDERYAVPSLDEVKKYKRFEKSHHRDGRRSPNHVN